MSDIVLLLAGILVLVLGLANHFVRRFATQKRDKENELFLTYHLDRVCSKAIEKKERKCLTCPFIEMYGHLNPELLERYEKWLET